MSDQEKKQIIDIETATYEFERFCDAWELDHEEELMKSDDKADFSKLKNQIIKAIQKNRLYLNEDETLTYIISEKTANPKKQNEKLIIKRPTGATYLSMDKYKDGQGMHKFNSILGAMSNHAPEYFSDLDGIDLKPLQAIVSIFLAE